MNLEILNGRWPFWLGALALAITAVGNTEANRRFTFGVRGPSRRLRQHAMGAVVYLLTLGLTAGALGVLRGVDPSAPRAVELCVLVSASAVATATRYVALRSWVFARRRVLTTKGTARVNVADQPPVPS